MANDNGAKPSPARRFVGRARFSAAALRGIAGGALAERHPSLDVIGQDLRHAVRRLRDNPMATTAAVLTLAIGMGAVTSVYTIGDALVFHPLPYPEADRLVGLGDETPSSRPDGESWTHPAEFVRWVNLESLQSVAALRPYFATMTGAGDPVEVIGYRATPSFFEVIGVQPVLGRAFRGDADGMVSPAEEGAVVLGHSFWQRYFGSDPDALGRRVRIGEQAGVIVGIMPRGAEFPMGTDLLVPLVLQSGAESSYESSLRTIGRLAPGVSVERLQAELAPLDAIAAEQRPDTHADVRIAVEPILDQVTFGSRIAFSFLMGAATCLLLLVCANVANIQLAQSAGRRREIATRKALGAPRRRLVRQLLTEGLLLSAIAAIAGTLFAVWSSSVIAVGLADESLRFFFAGIERIGINASVLAFTVTVSLGTVVVFGLVPALHGSAVELHEVLKQTAPGVRRGNRLRNVLVVVEVAVSVVLLAGAGLMARSIGAFTRFEPGIDTNVVTMRLRLPSSGYDDASRRLAFFDESVAAARQLPGVEAAALTNRMPVTGDERGTAVIIEPAGDAPGELRAERHVIGPGYFETLGISIARGRGFDSRDRAGAAGVVVVSEAFAERAWPALPPIGRRLRFAEGDPWLTTIGVATDVARAFNDTRPASAVYLPTEQSSSTTGLLLLRPNSDPGGLAAALRERIWAIDDGVVVFAPRSIDEALGEQAWGLRGMAWLVGWIAGAALLVCLAGIYALVAFSAAQRTREIGVRLALGADGRGVVRLLVSHGMRTVATGLAIGLLAAFGFSRLLAGFGDGVIGSTNAPLAPQATIFLALAGGILGMAVLSSWWPARRAARVDPVVTLRAE